MEDQMWIPKLTMRMILLYLVRLRKICDIGSHSTMQKEEGF